MLKVDAQERKSLHTALMDVDMKLIIYGWLSIGYPWLTIYDWLATVYPWLVSYDWLSMSIRDYTVFVAATHLPCKQEHQSCRHLHLYTATGIEYTFCSKCRISSIIRLMLTLEGLEGLRFY